MYMVHGGLSHVVPELLSRIKNIENTNSLDIYSSDHKELCFVVMQLK